MDREKCREMISRMAAKSRFLNLRDGRPRVNEFLQSLDSAFSSARSDVMQEVEKAKKNLGELINETCVELERCLGTLKTGFSEARAQEPPAPERIEQLLSVLESELRTLHVRVRPQMQWRMEALAPQRRLIQTVLGSVARAYRGPLEGIPDDLILITPSGDPSSSLEGATILEKESEAIVEGSCRSTLSVRCYLLYLDRLWAMRRKYHAVTVPLAGIANLRLPSPEQQEEHALVKEYGAAYGQALSAVGDTWRNIRFSMQTAVDEVTGVVPLPGPESVEGEAGGPGDSAAALEKAEGLVVDLMTHAQESLRSVEDGLTEFLDGIEGVVAADHGKIREAILADLRRSGSLAVRLNRPRKALQHSLRRLSAQVRGWVALGRKEGVRSAGTIRGLAAGYLDWMRQFAGLPAKRQESLLQLADLPSDRELERVMEDLPHVYRGLFSLGPLKSREFLVGREEEMEKLGEILARWEQELACSVAMVGPEGSGKTSLLNCFEDEFRSRATFRRLEIESRLRAEKDVLDLFSRWFEPPEPFASIEATIAHLRQIPRVVIVVEAGHNLILRTMGGARPAEAFLRVVMATRERHLWVVAFRENPWKRMEYLFQVSRFFTHTIQTLFHNEKEIREALLLRQHTSGYPIVFTGEDGQRDTAETAEALKAARTRETRFYSRLFEASRGNFEAAIYYWLITINWDSGEEVFLMPPLGRLDHSYLRDLDRSYLFALAEILCHGGLSLREFQEIFHWGEERCKMVLDYLLQLRLFRSVGLEAGSGDGHYIVNPAFYAPVTAVLQDLNILY